MPPSSRTATTPTRSADPDDNEPLPELLDVVVAVVVSADELDEPYENELVPSDDVLEPAANAWAGPNKLTTVAKQATVIRNVRVRLS